VRYCCFVLVLTQHDGSTVLASIPRSTQCDCVLCGAACAAVWARATTVDYDTDAVIQRLLREHPSFKKATHVVVAHRISTVIDSDLIVVMGDGKVLEQGSPAELLAKPACCSWGLPTDA
jgi:hypothetical protein